MHFQAVIVNPGRSTVARRYLPTQIPVSSYRVEAQVIQWSIAYPIHELAVTSGTCTATTQGQLSEA